MRADADDIMGKKRLAFFVQFFECGGRPTLEEFKSLSEEQAAAMAVARDEVEVARAVKLKLVELAVERRPRAFKSALGSSGSLSLEMRAAVDSMAERRRA